ncbi:GntR family transcriptional regulator [Roseomonas gilardii]|uniref:GntR family transcriptional regulator n=1 Tax=Roseomonas gilardii TaxID=257708 RepID=UPI001643D9B0|nr:GntR family transcriptional regulator [Roseomonas gilardii]
MFRKVAPAPQITDTVYETLREAICDGVLPPDARLIQDELAERLGTSRQPVHLALQQLKKDGFVTEVGRRGLVVAPLDRAFAAELYEMRAALDAAAAVAAAKRAEAEDRKRGERIIREGRAAVADGDLAAMASADFAFHDFIYGLAGNRLIAQTARMNWHHIRRSIMLLAGEPTKLGPFWDEHDQILQAVVARDPEAAAQLAQYHALASSQILSRLEKA